MTQKGEIEVTLTIFYTTTFLRSSVPSFYRLISSASAPAMMFCTSFTSGTRWSQFLSQSRFCTIDRISRCRSFVTPENRHGLCSGREKIFAIGDPQYVHLCGKRLYVWQTRRHITLFISVECWPSCFSIDMLDDPYSSLKVLSSSHARLNLNPISSRMFLSCSLHFGNYFTSKLLLFMKVIYKR